MHINCHSYYSLRYGTYPVEELVSAAMERSAGVIALTDINNSTGIPYFVRDCEKAGIKPVGGIEFRNDSRMLYIGLARNNDGMRELNEFLTEHNFSGEPFPFPAPQFSNAYTVYPLEGYPSTMRENEMIGIRPSETGRLLTVGGKIGTGRMVVMAPVTFEGETGYEIHRNLRAVDRNILISHLKPRHSAAPDETFITAERLREMFSTYPDIIDSTMKMLDDCTITFKNDVARNRKLFSSSRRDDRQLLEKLAWDGMIYRYGKNNREARERIEKELEIIDRLGFSSYFLITWDIIRYSMSRGFTM